MRPYLGEVEGVEAIGLGLIERHDLHMQGPAWVVSALDCFVKVANVVIAIDAGQQICVRLGQEVDPLVGLDNDISPKTSEPSR